jgi:hypothetical protein
MTTQKTAKRGEFNPNWPVPDDYLLELGRMVSVWGSLEFDDRVGDREAGRLRLAD